MQGEYHIIYNTNVHFSLLVVCAHNTILIHYTIGTIGTIGTMQSLLCNEFPISDAWNYKLALYINYVDSKLKKEHVVVFCRFMIYLVLSSVLVSSI